MEGGELRRAHPDKRENKRKGTLIFFFIDRGFNIKVVAESVFHFGLGTIIA
jgi:hypothetical protein